MFSACKGMDPVRQKIGILTTIVAKQHPTKEEWNDLQEDDRKIMTILYRVTLETTGQTPPQDCDKDIVLKLMTLIKNRIHPNFDDWACVEPRYRHGLVALYVTKMDKTFAAFVKRIKMRYEQLIQVD